MRVCGILVLAVGVAGECAHDVARGVLEHFAIALIEFEVIVLDHLLRQREVLSYLRGHFADALNAEVVDLEPAAVVGCRGAVVLLVAALDAECKVLTLVHRDVDFHVAKDDVVSAATGITGIGVDFTIGKQVGVVALIAVVLHILVGKETAVGLSAILHPKHAAHLIDARFDAVGRNGLREFKC